MQNSEDRNGEKVRNTSIPFYTFDVQIRLPFRLIKILCIGKFKEISEETNDENLYKFQKKQMEKKSTKNTSILFYTFDVQIGLPFLLTKILCMGKGI